MKKILILSITLLLTANASFAQTDGPSKKETFDFIITMINKANSTTVDEYYTDDWTIKSTVHGEFSLTNTYSLVDLTSTKSELYNGNYIVYLNFKKQIKYYSFSKKYGGGEYIQGRTQALYKFSGEKDKIRFVKSLKYWIKLNNVNESLFDD